MNFKKKKNEELKEGPLGYWEKESYMLVVPEAENENMLENIFEQVAKIDGVEIKGKQPLTEEKPGNIVLKYENEEYNVGFYISKFSLPEFYIKQPYYFSEDEIKRIKGAKSAVTIFMKFNDEPKKAYHLQLKLALAIVPNTIGIMDESAEKMLPSKWAKMAAESKILPSANDLYTVQAITAENGEVWLHTHGLCRCGITEIEILQSDKENYNNHYNIITTFASYLIDKKGKNTDKGAYIGILSNRQPVVVTCLPWTKALKEYEKLELGNIKDRQEGHNSKRSIIFIYKSEQDEKEGKLTKVSEFNNLWGENPIFFISTEETKRMKDLAKERFYFVKEAMSKKENRIDVKIGVSVDNNDDFEHIWFQIIEFNGDKFKARLLQEPYNIKDLHTGDESWYTVEDVTDWVISTPKISVNPGTAYILK